MIFQYFAQLVAHLRICVDRRTRIIIGYEEEKRVVIAIICKKSISETG